MTENRDLRNQTISHIIRVVGQLIWLGNKRFARQFINYGLTVPQYFTLFSLWHLREPCPMHLLAEITHQDAATLTGVIDRLIRLGYVSRRRGRDDRRKVYVTLCEAGRQVVEEVGEGRHEIWQRGFASLSQAELDEMLRILQTIMHTLQAASQPAEEEARANRTTNQPSLEEV
jgi:DNA-binding MarR family transcriptional regulator